MKKEKVVVGLSGGVDSSVAALLLLEQGYEVEGLFMRNWDSAANGDVLGNVQNNSDICPQEQDYQDAMAIANKLGIKLHRVDFVREYWDYVFQYFIEEYECGRTPNPDILCNKYIKFDKFLNYALKELGANKIAMGHYAGVAYNEQTQEFELLRASDQSKDQTYFLAQLNQNQLAKTLFPLANLTKKTVREIARKYDLITADKKDSTGICFIGERQFTKFLENYISNQPGDIIDIHTKRVLGRHIGVMYYTIGQRKGLKLGGMEEPYYVAKKDVRNKILYVTRASDESWLMAKSAKVEDLNWIVNLQKYVKNPQDFAATAKFRYHQQDTIVNVKQVSFDSYLVNFACEVKAVTEGQQAVFYLGNLCLGGGVISQVMNS